MTSTINRWLLWTVVLSSIGTDQLVAQTYNVLHAFTPLLGSPATNSDGANPAAGLVLSGHVLYGTASHGGAFGVGALFALNPDGTGFTNLHNFSPVFGPQSTNSDGAYPVGGLILSGNTLYGTATYGGNSGAGTVFKINTDGTGFKTLHSFSATSGVLFANGDGAHPQAAVVMVSGTLYGTAPDGGESGNGVVFALNPDSTEFTNLYNFSAAYFNNTTGYYTNLDGANPLSALLFSNKTLYGTVVYGGPAGLGAVFALNTNGTGFVNLHHFTLVARDPQGNYTNSDGANPASPLILSGDRLVGTAQNGGSAGSGTVFAMRTDGSAVAPLHTFGTGKDGAHPVAGLFLSGQTLYGCTGAGGGSGTGAIFQLNTNGTGYTVLRSFSALSSQTNSDGAVPLGELMLSGNTLLGTTFTGAAAGSGALFALSLGPTSPPQLSINHYGQNVVLTWPTDSLGFSLQSSTNLSSSLLWSNTPSSPVIINGQNTVTNPISDAQTFFRLKR
jgi:uncharacterized repeat protein (TIGR03803 family)